MTEFQAAVRRLLEQGRGGYLFKGFAEGLREFVEKLEDGVGNLWDLESRLSDLVWELEGVYSGAEDFSDEEWEREYGDYEISREEFLRGLDRGLRLLRRGADMYSGSVDRLDGFLRKVSGMVPRESGSRRRRGRVVKEDYWGLVDTASGVASEIRDMWVVDAAEQLEKLKELAASVRGDLRSDLVREFEDILGKIDKALNVIEDASLELS